MSLATEREMLSSRSFNTEIYNASICILTWKWKMSIHVLLVIVRTVSVDMFCWKTTREPFCIKTFHNIIMFCGNLVLRHYLAVLCILTKYSFRIMSYFLYNTIKKVENGYWGTQSKFQCVLEGFEKPFILVILKFLSVLQNIISKSTFYFKVLWANWNHFSGWLKNQIMVLNTVYILGD